MQYINLPSAKLEGKGDEIVITHLKSGMKITVEQAKLDRWALAQLRSQITTTKEPK